MSLHISLVPPHILCGESGDVDFIDAKFIVQNQWKTRVAMGVFGCRDCLSELREVMRTARPIR